MRAYRWVAVVAGVSMMTGALAAGAGASTSSTGVLHGDTYVKVAKVTNASFEKSGPYAVGEYTLPLSVTDANGTTYATMMDVWYPAVKGAGAPVTYNVGQWLPAALQPLLNKNKTTKAEAAKATYIESAQSGLKVASGTFPLAVFAHGYAGFRDQSTYLTTHLASWGFVVVATDGVQYDLTSVINQSFLSIKPVSSDPNADVADMRAEISAMGSTGIGLVQGHVDATNVIAFGHSAGGSAVEKLASYETVNGGTTPYLKGWIGLAGASISGIGGSLVAPYNVVPAIPGVIVGGGQDHVVPMTGLKTAYGQLTASRRIIELTNVGHQEFSDLCAINQGHGGLVTIADALGVTLNPTLKTLATDGCFTKSGKIYNVATDWPIVNQIVTAAARQDLGFDTSTAGLDNLQKAYKSEVSLDTTSSL